MPFLERIFAAALMAGLVASAANTPASLITSVRQVRALTAEEAARRLPVRLTATVTYLVPEVYLMYVQDGREAVYVQPSSSREDPRLARAIVGHA